MFQKSEVPQTMPARRSTRTDPGGGGDSLSSPSEKPKKDKKSHIPLMQSSKIISKQPTLPAVISAKKKTLAASASSSKMPTVTPINLKFGAKYAAAAAKSKGQNSCISKFVSEIESSRTFLLIQARSQATYQMKDLIKTFHFKL